MTASVTELITNLREVISSSRLQPGLYTTSNLAKVSSSFSDPPAHRLSLAEEGVVGAPADAAGGEEEPVHEDPGAVVVGVIGQEPVPLVLLLARTVPRTPQRQRAAGQANIFM